eukprot:12050186-Ditylum_brightwellii.AAC.1
MCRICDFFFARCDANCADDVPMKHQYVVVAQGSFLIQGLPVQLSTSEALTPECLSDMTMTGATKPSRRLENAVSQLFEG